MIKNEDIRSLVKMYFGEDRQSVIDTYGPISKWDVSGVTDMSKLFSFIKKINELRFSIDETCCGNKLFLL